jgi:hypothetical protein
MSIVLPALAVAFAAICVWLAVRIFNRRERWAKWTLAVSIGIPALYMLSFGPACWLASRDDGRVPECYWPVGWAAFQSRLVSTPIIWFAKTGMEAESSISLTRFPGKHARHPDFCIIIIR